MGSQYHFTIISNYQFSVGPIQYRHVMYLCGHAYIKAGVWSNTLSLTP